MARSRPAKGGGSAVARAMTPRRLPVIAVRLAQSLDEVALVWEAMQAETLRWYWTDWSPADWAALCQSLGTETLVVVGLVDGAVAGAGFVNTMVLHPATRQPLYCNVDLYVLPAHRGAEAVAMGKQIKAFVLETLGFPQFFCTIRVPHKASQQYAAKAGMVRCGVIPSYLPVDGALEDCVLYAAVPPKGPRDG